MRAIVLLIVLLVSGCGWREVIEPAPVYTARLQAETRRAQVIAEIARLNRALLLVRNVETRIVLEGQLNERRVELDRLNAIISP